jgi:hypothetical protein
MFHNKLFRLVRGRCSRQRGLLIGPDLRLRDMPVRGGVRDYELRPEWDD